MKASREKIKGVSIMFFFFFFFFFLSPIQILFLPVVYAILSSLFPTVAFPIQYFNCIVN